MSHNLVQLRLKLPAILGHLATKAKKCLGGFVLVPVLENSAPPSGPWIGLRLKVHDQKQAA
jgi:hypothetical protein